MKKTSTTNILAKIFKKTPEKKVRKKTKVKVVKKSTVPKTRVVKKTKATDRKSTRLNSSHSQQTRMPSSA